LLSCEERDLNHRLVKAGWTLHYQPTAAVIQQVLPERLTRRWFVRRGWAQGVSNARFEVLVNSLPARRKLARAVAEIRTSAGMYVRRRGTDPNELVALTRVLAHAGAAVEFLRLAVSRKRAMP
jgi:hypothetical protein